jgi:hypothetical protein
MSSSNRKIESSRINGAKSNGPYTDLGRQAVALNAVTYGLTAQTVILKNEPAEEFQVELQNYLDYFCPQGIPEERLVRQLVAADWRLARYTGVESGLLNEKMDQQADWIEEHRKNISDRERIAVAFESLANNGNSLVLANRYQARLQHDYQKLLKSLSQMQATRCAAEVKLPNEPNPIYEHTPEIVSPTIFNESDSDPRNDSEPRP